MFFGVFVFDLIGSFLKELFSLNWTGESSSEKKYSLATDLSRAPILVDLIHSLYNFAWRTVNKHGKKNVLRVWLEIEWDRTLIKIQNKTITRKMHEKKILNTPFYFIVFNSITSKKH